MLRPTYWSPWWKIKLWKWVRYGTFNENVSIKASFVVAGVTTLDLTVGKRGFYKKLLWIFYAWELVFFPSALLKTPSSFTVRPHDTRGRTSARRTDVRRQRLYFPLLFDPLGRPPPALCRSFFAWRNQNDCCDIVFDLFTLLAGGRRSPLRNVWPLLFYFIFSSTFKLLIAARSF